MTTVYCSGLFSGPNPSPGLGVARSLREAMPDVQIVGVDYSTRSTGLHHPVFDKVWIQRPWAELDLNAYGAAIRKRLDSGALWISGLDLETRWLAKAIGEHPGLLIPPRAALERIVKPATEIASRLGLRTPPTVSARAPHWELHAFGREHGWRLWLKGPYYEAVRVGGWGPLQAAYQRLTQTWATDELHVQAHVTGIEESIVFAAHDGGLLAARHMRKRIVTEQGKTWAGAVATVDGGLLGVAQRLADEVALVGWTGGGELEMLRSSDGELWLLEVNPRFPAWVHGVTLTGANLPATLVASAAGHPNDFCTHRGRAFARVVVEIPLREGFDLPEPVMAVSGGVTSGKHPSGMPELARRITHEQHVPRRSPPSPPPPAMSASIAELHGAARTPHVHVIEPDARWARWADRVRACTGDSCDIRLAYSIKTDPRPELLSAALACGFLAEAISGSEARLARRIGFADDEIVLNGPAKRWPSSDPATRAYATFADSCGELVLLMRMCESGELAARYVGPRLRPPPLDSRFGVPLGEFAAFNELVDGLQTLPESQRVGVHVHLASSESGHDTWFDAVEATLAWARHLQDLTGCAVRCLDLGGGWFPDDFEAVLLPRLAELVALARSELTELESLLLEPGKALSQPASVVESTVLELRSIKEAREIVVDASIAELPEAAAYPHRMLSRTPGGWKVWGRGPDRVLGRLCMEADVIGTGVGVPDDVRIGTRILIADAGAYDRSMAYEFGCG